MIRLLYPKLGAKFVLKNRLLTVQYFSSLLDLIFMLFSAVYRAGFSPFITRIILTIFALFGFIATNKLAAQVRFEFESDTIKFNYDVPQEFVVLNGKQYFDMDDGFFGDELWEFDPQTESARRLTDLRVSSGGAKPRELTLYSNKLYFTAVAETGWREIYRYDPVADAVQQVTNKQFDRELVHDLYVLYGKLWFSASKGDRQNLWFYDVVTDQTTELPTPPGAITELFAPQGLGGHAGQLYFFGRYDTHWALWRLNPATLTFEYLPTKVDQWSNDFNIQLQNVVSCGGELLMRIFNSQLGIYWYRYDVSSGDLIKFQNLGLYHYPGDLYAVYDNRFWFIASSKAWVFDPATLEITSLDSMINGLPENFEAIKYLDGKIFFRGSNPQQGIGVWSYDPLVDTVQHLAVFDSIPPLFYSLIRSGTNYFAFTGTYGKNRVNRYSSNGQISSVANNLNLWNASGNPHLIALYGEKVFLDNDGSTVFLDTSSGEYRDFSSILNQQPWIHVTPPCTEVNGRLYFSVYCDEDDQCKKLVSYQHGDDTLRIHPITDVSDPQGQQALRIVGSFDNRIYYYDRINTANGKANKICTYDVLLDSSWVLPATNHVILSGHTILHQGYLFFWAYLDSEPGVERYWKLDLNTYQLTELNFQSPNLPAQLYVDRSLEYLWEKYIVFECSYMSPTAGYTTTLLLYDISANQYHLIATPPGFPLLIVKSHTVYNNELCFNILYAPTKVFAISPVDLNCHLVYDFLSSGFTNVESLTTFANELYFAGEDWNYGSELRRLDPMTGEVQLIADIQPAGGGSYPSNYFTINNRLYFNASDGYRGFELWSYGDCYSLDYTIQHSVQGQNNGQVNLQLEGGVLPFTFLWSNGETTQNLSNLESGAYTVTITDGANCSATQLFLISTTKPTSENKEVEQHTMLTVFPNPLPEGAALNIQIENDRTGPVKFDLFTTDGRLVSSFTKYKTGQTLVFAQAIYDKGHGKGPLFLRVTDEKSVTSKLILGN